MGATLTSGESVISSGEDTGNVDEETTQGDDTNTGDDGLLADAVHTTTHVNNTHITLVNYYN